MILMSLRVIKSPYLYIISQKNSFFYTLNECNFENTKVLNKTQIFLKSRKKAMRFKHQH